VKKGGSLFFLKKKKSGQMLNPDSKSVVGKSRFVLDFFFPTSLFFSWEEKHQSAPLTLSSFHRSIRHI
jgi:hypothetical protein